MCFFVNSDPQEFSAHGNSGRGCASALGCGIGDLIPVGIVDCGIAGRGGTGGRCSIVGKGAGQDGLPFQFVIGVVAIK